MKKELTVLKSGDWSLNLEDPYYETRIDDIFAESVDAVRQTKEGRYVNLVTTGVHGDPRDWFIAPLQDLLRDAGLAVREIRYIDECGCGGHVTRVFR